MKGFSSGEIKAFVSARIEKPAMTENVSGYPKISIITPSYNQKEYLEKTILSVINQGYPNLEFIVLDGGSTDGSVEVIKKYSRFITRWVSEPDKGQEDAINKGFKIATGELVAWQNSDDIFLPGALRTVAEEYRKDPDRDVWFGNVYLINERDDIIKEMRYVPFNLDHLTYYAWNLSNQGVFWKRSLFEKCGYLEDFDYLFDLEWFIRLGTCTKKFKHIRSFIGGYRIHSTAKSSLIQENRHWSIFVRIMQHHGIPINPGKPWKYQHAGKKLKAFARKFVWYVLQGDAGYIFGGLVRRMRYGK